MQGNLFRREDRFQVFHWLSGAIAYWQEEFMKLDEKCQYLHREVVLLRTESSRNLQGGTQSVALKVGSCEVPLCFCGAGQCHVKNIEINNTLALTIRQLLQRWAS